MADEKVIPVGDEFDSPKTTDQLKQELAALEQESAQLDLELKREQVADIRRRRANRKAEIDARMDASKRELAQRDFFQQHVCTHRKGGRGQNAVLGGQGTDSNYAVIHHMLPSGRHFILCQRCGREEYGRDPLTGAKETASYQEWRKWQTDNSASTSSIFIPVAVYNQQAGRE